jgi:hypothetical protein
LELIATIGGENVVMGWCPVLTAYAKRPAALLPIYGLWEIDFPLTAKLEMELEGDVLNIYRPKN